MDRHCAQCSAPFEITDQDRAFNAETGVPPPTHCYLCRMQRRLSYRNERHLYHRKCDLTGKQIVSQFSVDKPFPVYENDAWWSDGWDPLAYGRTFDPARSFFEQFFALRNVVPRLAMTHQKPMENSDYCNCASRNKNCYLIFSTNHCEDCYYGSWVNYSKDCIDNSYIIECELCYECVGCQGCYNLRYSRDCNNCRDSFFLRSCAGCKNCFGCSNQVQKQYMVFNEQKTKEEYEAFLQKVRTGSHREMHQAREKIDGILHDMIVKEFHGSNIENSVGDYLNDCKNCFTCFECDHSEDLRYCICVHNAKSCMDYSYWGQNAQRLYECQACGYDIFQLRFCNLCWSGCNDLTYCDHCFSTKNCFGCVGLKKQEHCILNRQYTKEEYEDLVPRIIAKMRSTPLRSPAGSSAGQACEWGEFFPIAMSPFGYNETVAQEQMPLTKEQVLARGWQWHDEEETQRERYLGPSIEIPDDIADVSDDITKQILTCAVTGKPYKIIPQELKFYRAMGIPVPRRCPDQRHKERLALRNPRRLWDRQCAKCHKPIATSYSPDRPEIVYCENCYLKEVY